uniref:ArsA_HSP20 domain-containing protein n=2 Tax=Caenorhabditis tropicalis TaxID=1561998 RepID=A0A1I7UCR1_9PELO
MMVFDNIILDVEIEKIYVIIVERRSIVQQIFFLIKCLVLKKFNSCVNNVIHISNRELNFQLDRHFKKFHFQSSKCTNCDYISETPLQNSRHVLSCLNRIICGYCNLENPDKDHVKEMHWRRLERPIPKRVADKINKNAKELRKEIPRTPPEEQLIDKESNNVEDDIDESSEITEIRNQSRQDKYSEEKQIIESEDDDPFFNFSEPSTSQFDFSSTVFGDEDETPEEYLTFSISPKDSDLSYHLRGRLPSELVDLFPELENTSIVLLNSGMSPRCRMDVQVPVSIPNACENEEEMRNWLENVIFLDDDS